MVLMSRAQQNTCPLWSMGSARVPHDGLRGGADKSVYFKQSELGCEEPTCTQSLNLSCTGTQWTPLI